MRVTLVMSKKNLKKCRSHKRVEVQNRNSICLKSGNEYIWVSVVD